MFTYPFSYLGGGKKYLEVDFIEARTSATAGTNHSYSNVNLGEPSPDRHIVLNIGLYRFASAVPSNVMIGGVSATMVIANTGAGNPVSMWIAKVPTGNIGNITFTVAASTSGTSIGVHSIKGADTLNVDFTQQGATVNNNVNITVPLIKAGSVVIGYGSSYETTANCNFTGLDRVYNNVVASIVNYGGANRKFDSEISNHPISLVRSAGSTQRLLVAGFIAGE